VSTSGEALAATKLSAGAPVARRPSVLLLVAIAIGCLVAGIVVTVLAMKLLR
jgi:hypothetical protein